jgi:hypothetical protein
MVLPTLLLIIVTRRASAGSLSSTALALTNHDKESFNFGVTAEPSVLRLACTM